MGGSHTDDHEASRTGALAVTRADAGAGLPPEAAQGLAELARRAEHYPPATNVLGPFVFLLPVWFVVSGVWILGFVHPGTWLAVPAWVAAFFAFGAVSGRQERALKAEYEALLPAGGTDRRAADLWLAGEDSAGAKRLREALGLKPVPATPEAAGSSKVPEQASTPADVEAAGPAPAAPRKPSRQERRDEKRREDALLAEGKAREHAVAAERAAHHAALRARAAARPEPIGPEAAYDVFCCGGCGSLIRAFPDDSAVIVCSSCGVLLTVPAATVCPECRNGVGHPHTEWVEPGAQGHWAEAAVGGAMLGAPGAVGAWLLGAARDAVAGGGAKPGAEPLTLFWCGRHVWGMKLPTVTGLAREDRSALARRLGEADDLATGVTSRALVELLRDGDPGVAAEALRTAAAVGTPALLPWIDASPSGDPECVEFARQAREAIGARDYGVDEHPGTWNTNRRALCRRCRAGVGLGAWRCPTCGTVQIADRRVPRDEESRRRWREAAQGKFGTSLTDPELAVLAVWQEYVMRLGGDDRVRIEANLTRLCELAAKHGLRDQLEDGEQILGMAGSPRKPLLVTTRALRWHDASRDGSRDSQANAGRLRCRAFAEIDPTGVRLTGIGRIHTSREVVETDYDDPAEVRHLAWFLWEAASLVAAPGARCGWCGSAAAPVEHGTRPRTCRSCLGAFDAQDAAREHLT